MRTVQLETHNVHYTPGQCFCTVRGWGGAPLRRVTTWCPNDAAAGAPYCAAHETRRQHWLTRHPVVAGQQVHPAEVGNAIADALFEGLVAHEPPLDWRHAIRALAAANEFNLTVRRRAAARYYRLPRTRNMEPPHLRIGGGRRFAVYWRWVIDGQQGPEPAADVVPPQPPPQPALAAIARDTQNVHTRVVTEQTNSATEKLLAVKVPESQQTEKALAIVWLGKLDVSYGRFLRVANDVNRWFTTKDCRTTDDNLYRKLLRGLVAMIAAEKDDERKSELFRRMWEECCESVGMCCEGHISRLCNVLVGFDEAFQPPVPFGEILQSKMAAIAGLDASEEEKRRLATAFFDEYATPAEERVAWLDAF